MAAEIARHNTISNILGCTWVRYDPYAPNFDIFGLINDVGIQLLSAVKSEIGKELKGYSDERSIRSNMAGETVEELSRLQAEADLEYGSKKGLLEIRLAELAIRRAEIELATISKNSDGEVQKEIEKTKQAVERTKQSELEIRRIEMAAQSSNSKSNGLGVQNEIQGVEEDAQAITAEIAVNEASFDGAESAQASQGGQPGPLPNIILRPARRRQPEMPTSVRDFPFQPFLDAHLEPERDMNKGLQWKDLKDRFREWHSREFPRERLTDKLPRAIQDYFSSKLGGWHDTSRAGVKVKGFFGWRLRDLSRAPARETQCDTRHGPRELCSDKSQVVDGQLRNDLWDGGDATDFSRSDG